MLHAGSIPCGWSFGEGQGSPLKPGFGLSGDVQISNSIIPTGADHRESGDLWSGGGPLFLMSPAARDA